MGCKYQFENFQFLWVVSTNSEIFNCAWIGPIFRHLKIIFLGTLSEEKAFLGATMRFFNSSVEQSFLVISDQEFISSVPPSSNEEHRAAVARANELIKDWETSKTVLLADFEGNLL
jgi:hypothetical protein